jgi:hypothetical protein
VEGISSLKNRIILVTDNYVDYEEIEGMGFKRPYDRENGTWFNLYEQNKNKLRKKDGEALKKIELS